MTRFRRVATMARLLTKPRELREHLGVMANQAQDIATYVPLFTKYQNYTMVPRNTFIHNLQIVNSFRHIDGCVVEGGVWRGGCLAGMAEVLGTGRTYHAFDSFAGLPPAEDEDGPAARRWQCDPYGPNFHENCTAPQGFVEKAMHMAGATRVQIHPGWFDETLPRFQPDEPIAILRLDSDWYKSTMICLQFLFQHLAPGGLVIIDDYHTWDGCARAVHDYLAETKCQATIKQWRDNIAYLVAPAHDTTSRP